MLLDHFLSINENVVINFVIKFKGCFQIIAIKHFGYLKQFSKSIAVLVKVEFQDFKLDFLCNLFRLIFLIAFIHENTANF
jgi:hypothetical protein